jgi:O-antigen/teichoic acid export membrane protein
MGLVQKDAFRTTVISYLGIILGYFNKGILFLILLTTEQIGLINLMVSVGMLFAQFANFGMIYSTWKFLPFFRDKEKKNHGFLPLILSIVVVGILSCTIVALVFRQEIEFLYLKNSKMFIQYYLWILPIGISYVLFMVVEIYLRSLFKNIVSVIAFELIFRFSLTVLLFLIWMKIISFDTFVIAHSVFYFIPTIILFFYLQYLKELNLSFSSIKIPSKFKKIIFQFSTFNYINTLGIVLVSSLDVMMIAQMKGLVQTGIYTTVVFLTSALLVPYKSIIRISSPLVADYWKRREMLKMKELYQKVSSVSLVIGLGAFVWVWLNIDFLFSFLSPEFMEGKWVFFFLMLGKLLDMFFGLNGSIFITSKKYKYDILFTLFLIIAVFLLNLVFIPKLGMVGAAISTSLAIIVYNVGRLLFVWYVFKIHPFNKQQIKIIFLGLITLFIGYLSSNYFENRWLQSLFMSIEFGLFFIVPIYVFRLEPDIINYLQKSGAFVKQKLRSKK